MRDADRALLDRIAMLERRLNLVEGKARQSWVHTPSSNQRVTAFEVNVRQTAHGFNRGEAVFRSSVSTWALLTSSGAQVVASTGLQATNAISTPLWGVISKVVSADEFVVVLDGIVEIPGASLDPGLTYTFVSGAPVWYEPGFGAGLSVVNPIAKAYDATHVFVSNTTLSSFQFSAGAVFVASNTPAGYTLGNYVSLGNDGVSAADLALADPAAPHRWQHVGIAVYDGILLVSGKAWYYESGNTVPAWLNTPPTLAGGRVLLSSTNPGQYATAAEDFKVCVGPVSASYNAVDDVTTYSFDARQPSVWPIEWDDVANKPTAFPPSGSITLNINTTDTSNSPALTFTGSIGSQTWDFYEKRPRFNAKWLQDFEVSGTDPIAKQFLRFDGTSWSPYGPLLSAANELLSHDGTDLATVAAPTANLQILYRVSASALGWLAAPSTSGHVLQYNGTTLTWAAVSGLPTVTSSDEGKMLYVNSSGVWTNTRDVYLGDNPLTASSTQGSFGVVTSNDGDYIKLSSAGIEIYDRSISSVTPLIVINIGHSSLNATGRALSVREIDVCDAGVAKKMLVVGSAPY